eukprot:gene18092-biopygen34493
MLAGSGAAGFADGTGAAAAFSDPFGVAYSPDGATIAVADMGNNRVRLVAVGTGAVSTLAGSGALLEDAPAQFPTKRTRLLNKMLNKTNVKKLTKAASAGKRIPNHWEQMIRTALWVWLQDLYELRFYVHQSAV